MEKKNLFYANSLKRHFLAAMAYALATAKQGHIGKRLSSQPKAFPVPVNSNTGLGRNSPCPCGSGSKFKRCCQSKKSGS